MSKVKYYYDPDTLSYRKIEPKKGRRRRRIFLFLLFILSVAMGGAWYGYNKKLPLVEKDIPFSKRQVVELSKVLADVSKLLEHTQEQIETQEAYLPVLKETIHFRTDRANDTLEQIRKKRYDAAKDINRMVVKTNQLELAGEMERYHILAYELETLPVKMIVPVLTFILGFVANKLYVSFLKKKIVQKTKKSLEKEHEKQLAEIRVTINKSNDTIRKLKNSLKENEEKLALCGERVEYLKDVNKTLRDIKGGSSGQ